MSALIICSGDRICVQQSSTLPKKRNKLSTKYCPLFASAKCTANWKKKAAKKKLKNPPWPLEEALDDFEWQPSGNEWPKYFSFGFGFYLLLLASTSQIYRNRNRYRCRLCLEIQIQRTAWEIPDTSAVRLGYYQIAKLQAETSANGKWKNCVGCQCS